MSTSSLYDQALLALNDGEIIKAEKCLKEVVASKPQDMVAKADSYFLLGMVQDKLAKLEAASENLEISFRLRKEMCAQDSSQPELIVKTALTGRILCSILEKIPANPERVVSLRRDCCALAESIGDPHALALEKVGLALAICRQAKLVETSGNDLFVQAAKILSSIDAKDLMNDSDKVGVYENLEILSRHINWEGNEDVHQMVESQLRNLQQSDSHVPE
jgi:hypothetical protein